MISIKSCNKTMEQLKRVPLKSPEHAGFQWKGIKHSDMISAMFASVLDSGGFPHRLRCHVSNDGMDMVAAFAINKGPTLIPGFESWIGVSTSNSRRQGMRFYAGAMEEETCVPIITDMFTALHKKTLHFNLADEVKSAVDLWWKKMAPVPLFLNYFQHIPINQQELAEILVKAGRRGHIPWSRIGKVDRSFKLEKSKTAWALVRAFHEVNSLSPAPDQLMRNICFCQLLPIKN